MSKGQKRSNRETKKPKQVKPKAVAAPAISATAQTKQDVFARRKRWS